MDEEPETVAIEGNIGIFPIDTKVAGEIDGNALIRRSDVIEMLKGEIEKREYMLHDKRTASNPHINEEVVESELSTLRSFKQKLTEED